MGTELKGRTALITGAGRGIGRATAIRLARDGARIAINYKGNADAAAEAKALVEKGGGEATLIQGDVSVDVEAENVVKAALAFGGGRIDILVNNAGITRDNLLVRMSAEDWDAVVDLNLRGAFLVTKAAMRPMMKQRAGRIVNVSSVAGVAGNAGQANYASAKAGLIGFTMPTGERAGHIVEIFRLNGHQPRLRTERLHRRGAASHQSASAAGRED